ncbi:MAG TPA: winged helix DNA-binding protein [Spirochaetota bacterium]|nr:winged helix DNA-binding protein [Spirochaetota bacterium]
MKIERNNLVYALGRLRRRALCILEREMTRRGINGIAPSFGDVFMIVAAGGPMSMKEIARRTYKDKSTITGVVKALERHGYFKRVADPEDGRATLISITPKAVKIIPALGEISALMNERLFGGLSARQSRTLFLLLEKMSSNLKYDETRDRRQARGITPGREAAC